MHFYMKKYFIILSLFSLSFSQHQFAGMIAPTGKSVLNVGVGQFRAIDCDGESCSRLYGRVSYYHDKSSPIFI